MARYYARRVSGGTPQESIEWVIVCLEIGGGVMLLRHAARRGLPDKPRPI